MLVLVHLWPLSLNIIVYNSPSAGSQQLKAMLHTDHPLRRKAFLKFLNNYKIVGWELTRFQFEMDEEQLTKIETILLTPLASHTVSATLEKYISGELTLEETDRICAPYLMAHRLKAHKVLEGL